MKKGRDYTVKYINNYTVGDAYAVITGIGDYWGCIAPSFVITPKKAQPLVLTKKKDNSVECEFGPKYQDNYYPTQLIEYSTDKTFKTKKSLFTTDYRKEVVTDLKEGKTYYFRMAHIIETASTVITFVNYKKDYKNYLVESSDLIKIRGKWSKVVSITV